MPEDDVRTHGLPDEIAALLLAHGVASGDEAVLREALEARVTGYTLVRMLPAAAKRWKARYRILVGDAYYDAQTAAEAYARALLAALTASKPPAAEGSPTPPSSAAPAER